MLGIFLKQIPDFLDIAKPHLHGDDAISQLQKTKSITTGTCSQLHHRFSRNTHSTFLSCRHCWNISDIAMTIRMSSSKLYLKYAIVSKCM